MGSQNQVHLHNLKDFLRLQTPDVLGLIWIDQSPERNVEAPFAWLNYFFNGTLELQSTHQKSNQSSMFITNQFGRDFYLGITSNEGLSDFLQQFVETAKINPENSKKVNILSKKDILIQRKAIKDKISYDLEFITY